jgi:GTP-binding protein
VKFVDLVRVHVRAGRGGNGAVAWRREKYVPKGGPAGGDGGDGGDVRLVADPHLSTLLELRFRPHLHAEDGKPGGTRDKNGRAGEDLEVRVPVGTVVVVDRASDEVRAPRALPKAAPDDDEDEMQTIYIGDDGRPMGADEVAEVFDESEDDDDEADETGLVLGDLATPGQTIIVARGGKGGRGNIHFRTATRQAPDHAEPGTEGEARWLRLELKLLADVGIVGFPNVGKSTFIAKVSRARPKIADYPFTTLVPQLGVVGLGEGRSMVVADVPGLIRGASEGRGLGLQFLRHLERTRVLLHLLAPDLDPDREPLADLAALEAELGQYGDVFANRPRVVAINKIDLLGDAEGKRTLSDLRRALQARGIPLFPICAHTGDGVPALLEALWRRVHPQRG